MASDIKIHAALAQAGLGSRRACEELVVQGQVTVNGQLAQIGQRINPDQDLITVKGKPIVLQPQTKLYFLVNKPAGIVSSVSDELNRRTVVDLLPRQSTRLYPVGRLDIDSEGLMLLTNDGDATYHLTHPKFEIHKVYEVLVSPIPTDNALEFLRRGVKLKEGMTRPAEVEVISTEDKQAWLRVEIHEGRNHQVRRMLERAGYETLRLIRTELGPFTLADVDGKVWRQLSDDEIQQLQQLVGQHPDASVTPPPVK